MITMDRKIKVMHLIWSMGDGGAQRIVLNYLRDFQDDPDIELKLFVYNSPTTSRYDREIKEKKYNVEYLNNPRSKIKIPIIRWPFNRRIAKKTWQRAISEYQPDIVHVHISELLNVTLKPIIKENVQLRFDTLHSNPKRYSGQTLKTIKRAFQSENVIPICVTSEQAKIAKEHYGIENYEVLYNGVDFRQIRANVISTSEARKEWGLPEDAFVILGVGRLDPIKNFPLLFEAFGVLAEKNSKAVLVIAGEGEEKKRLEKMADRLRISDKVFFLGNQDNMSHVYRAANVLGIPSLSESSSLVLLEAQALGLRCVISDGVPDESIITDKVNKMPVNAGIEQWADALADVSYFGEKICDEKDYEVHEVSSKLKKIYLKYWSKIEKNEKAVHRSNETVS